jgi:hypothetical protein
MNARVLFTTTLTFELFAVAPDKQRDQPTRIRYCLPHGEIQMTTATTTFAQSLELDKHFATVEQPRYTFVLDADLAHVGGGSALLEY